MLVRTVLSLYHAAVWRARLRFGGRRGSSIVPWRASQNPKKIASVSATLARFRRARFRPAQLIRGKRGSQKSRCPPDSQAKPVRATRQASRPSRAENP